MEAPDSLANSYYAKAYSHLIVNISFEPNVKVLAMLGYAILALRVEESGDIRLISI
jgi:hypothetical protein